jgi:acetate kinase
MKLLIANLGSTSFKYRLFDMSTETQLAQGGIDRIGGEVSDCFIVIGGVRSETQAVVEDHSVAVQKCLDQLTDPSNGCLKSATEVSGIGFKAVHGGSYSGVQLVTPDVLNEMELMGQAAPAHNPPYVSAMRLMGTQFPDLPLVAAFETGFHQTIADAQRYYATPRKWADQFQVKKWGFHGASHRFIGERMQQLLSAEKPRVISCHLGGSNSLCAMRDGVSVANTLGMSPQTGIPHNNRVGDFDPFALPIVMRETGKSLEEVLDDLANRSGLLGLSGISGDCRDLEKAAAAGNADAKLALDVFVAEIRRHLGGLLLQLGGAEAIVFTGGIGENGAAIRAAVCEGLSELGISLDDERNQSSDDETLISSDSSKVQIWVVPTNEEIVVARQTKLLLEG